jgi:hypothetical protein
VAWGSLEHAAVIAATNSTATQEVDLIMPGYVQDLSQHDSRV